MGQHARIDRVEADPAFEAPPRFGCNFERRLAGRAAARWSELRRVGTAMPTVAAYLVDRPAADAAEFGGNSLLLDLCDPSFVRIDRVGRVLERTFGATVGKMTDAGPTSLSRLVLAGAAAARQRPSIVPFEGALSADDLAPVTLLTRGVLLPLADPAGRLCAAHVVVTWKESLSPLAIRALRGELRLVLGDFRPVAAMNRAFGDGLPLVRH